MDLEQQLSAFDVPPTPGVISNPNIPSDKIIVEDGEATEAPESTDELELSLEETEEVEDSDSEEVQRRLSEENESEEEEETEDEDEELSPEFNAQFQDAFGINVDEARDLIGELQNFKSEMILMRDWGVNPIEFDTRINKVREFYNGLPEDGREKFNSPEGAKAIWNHISKNDSNTTKKKAPNRNKGTLGKSPSSRGKKPELIKRSDILKMNDDDYQKNYRRITKAFAENRIIEDI